MQSNFGIVTRMGVWLMPMPECYMPLWLRVWHDDDLPVLVETLRALMLDRTIENVPQIWNTIAFASVLSSRSEWYDGEEPIPDARIDEMARELEVGRWMMRFALYGDEAVVDHRFRKVKEAFERIPGAEVWGAKHAPDAFAELENPHERVQAEVPNLDINTMTGVVRRRGGEGTSASRPSRGSRAGRRRAARPDPRARRARGAARLRGGPHSHQRAQLHPRHDGHLRHEERGGGEARVRREPAPRA